MAGERSLYKQIRRWRKAVDETLAGPAAHRIVQTADSTDHGHLIDVEALRQRERPRAMAEHIVVPDKLQQQRIRMRRLRPRAIDGGAMLPEDVVLHAVIAACRVIDRPVLIEQVVNRRAVR